MDVQEHLARIRSVVDNARAMPMSASAVVNRAELLGMLDELAAELPRAFAEAQRVTADREGVVDEGRREAERIVAEAHHERERLVSDTEVYRIAKGEAERVRDEAELEAKELRRETDEYVDQRLANFEVTLGKTLEAVARGRERLHGRSDFDSLGRDDDEDLWLPGDDRRGRGPQEPHDWP